MRNVNITISRTSDHTNNTFLRNQTQTAIHDAIIASRNETLRQSFLTAARSDQREPREESGGRTSK